MLGSLGSAAIGAVGDIGGAFLQNEFNKGRMKDQFAYNREMYQNRYQWMMEDLRKAGLNPYLVPGLGGGGSGPGVGLPSSNAPQAGTSAVRAYQASQQAKLLAQQVKESKERTRMLGNQATQEWFKIATSSYDVHTARAKMIQEEKVAAAYEKFGPSGVARLLELFPSLAGTIMESLPKQSWSPRGGFPSRARGRDVAPHPVPSKKRDRSPTEPWKRRER